MFLIASIFIVEDDISIQMLYEKLLNLYGFEVVGTANNGEEAIIMFKSFSQKPDIILMDHRMPIKDGIETTKEILQLDHNVKILFASADKSIKQIAFSIGITGFIDKPFSLQKLVKKIDKILSIKSLHSNV